ncbi:hypothetical protein D3C71_1855610 [compost metagenome]
MGMRMCLYMATSEGGEGGAVMAATRGEDNTPILRLHPPGWKAHARPRLTRIKRGPRSGVGRHQR